MAVQDTTRDSNDDLSEYAGDEGIVRRWLKEIDTVKNSKAQVDFEKIGERIVRDYRNSGAMDALTSERATARVMLNVLWSNVQVLKPTLYSRMPKVVVERRFKDTDPVGRLAAQGCERATSFMMSTQQDRFNYAVRSAVEDRLLPGRGQVWLRYECEWCESNDENGQPLVDEEGNAIKVPKANTEKVCVDFVNWLDYLCSQSRNPYEDRWRAKRVYMTRSELIKRFGEKGKLCKLNHSQGDSGRSKLANEDVQFLRQAEVWEIEDSESKKRYWISEGYKEAPLDVKEDVLRLKDFFSSPIPLLATTTTDSSYPTADFKIYERLADELDKCTKRLSSMVECVRLVGATASRYNSDIKNMLNLQDGQIWPIDGWDKFKADGGWEGVINWLPFDQCVAAIPVLMQQQSNLLQQINLISGIPDIAQGSTDPNETAAAQQKKSHWTIVKVSDKQADVQRFCRDIISKVAEVIFEPGLFSDETISLMVGVAQMPPEDQQMWPQALQLLREDRLRTFRVDIETDSTIAIDEDAEKAARMEYIAAMNQLLGNIQNVAQFRPELVNPMIESALFAARAFRTGRPVEGAWERAMQQIEDNDARAAEQAAQQAAPPDIELMKVQNEAQSIAVKGQEIQVKQQQIMEEGQSHLSKLQFDQWLAMQELQLQQQKQQAEFEIATQKLSIESAKVGNEAEFNKLDQEISVFKAQFEQAAEAQRIKYEEMAGMLKIKESYIEEARLKQQDTEARIKEITSLASSSPKETTPPVIHIHNGGGSKEVTLKRNPDGTLLGRVNMVEAPSNG